MAQSGFTPIKLYYSATTTNVPLAANLAAGELAINTYDGKLFYKDSSGVVQVIGWKTTPATAGGTDQTSYAVGDLLYASTTTALSKLADIATGNALISGGVGVAPSYGKIGLTTHVSGTLPIANGGTGSTSTTYASLTTNVTGTLPVANGGTGVTTSTGTTNVVLSNSPTLVTPNINSAQFATVSGTAPLYAARAWVNFNGTGTPAIRASGNVSSITDNGTGDYTVNFTTAMSDADYSIGHIVGDTTGSAQAFLTPFTYATGSIRIQIFNTVSAAVDRNAVNISIFR